MKSASPFGSVCACYRFEKVIRDSEMSDRTTGFSTLQLLVGLAESKISITITQGRAETFGGAGAQSIKGAHGTRLLIGLCSLLICVSKWMLLY